MTHSSKNSGKIKYAFSGQIWQHDSPGGWHFISLPVPLAMEIREHLGGQEEGWGRMKVLAQLGQTEWETAIWFDTKRQTYLLPMKAEIRKKTGINRGDEVHICLLL